ncbi:MAG: TIM barrel protein [Acidobacteria bacterium]|nr:TIM barrel protein [Acidobacteriota bacterium]
MMKRRDFLGTVAAGVTAQAGAGLTRFQTACMTLPYAAFPMERALTGIQSAGYRYVAWGVSHRDASGTVRRMLEEKAPASEAAKLAARCRGMGLEPVMMFSTVHLEAADALELHLRRIDQAAAAGIPFLLTFGKTEPGQYESVIRNLKGMAGRARAAGVTVVIKQHGGNTATGAACARIVAEVGEEPIRICYDAGNVLDYDNSDPIADIGKCWRDVRAFAIKDHRNTPRDEDCGPGFGEIDHYKLLAPVMRTALTMPLACENIFEPLVSRPTEAAEVDTLAKRAREYLETVLRGLIQQEKTR